MSRFVVLVLGGYGVFGSRICRALARDPQIRVIVAGRSGPKAVALAKEIRRETPEADIAAQALTLPGDLRAGIDKAAADLVIHTCGPFQGQSYAVPKACIDQGVHYIDLADGRDFVCDFESLDAAARAAGVSAVTGASSVPGLSSSVVARLRPGFARLDSIAIGIAPGNRVRLGPAVVAAILSYVGKPLPRRQDGAWTHCFGWQDLQRRAITAPDLNGLGRRWFAACDVPDLTLLPACYPEARNVTFHAGLELALLQLGLWSLAWPVRWGLIDTWAPYAPWFAKAAGWLGRIGSDRGGMFVELEGETAAGKRLRRAWTLIAERGEGPWVPTVPATVLARNLARGEINERGARPCLGLISLEDFEAAVTGLQITTRMTESLSASGD